MHAPGQTFGLRMKAWLTRHPLPAPDCSVPISDRSPTRLCTCIQPTTEYSWSLGMSRTAEMVRTDLPHLNGPVPGPRAQAIIARDTRVVSPSYTRCYPLVAA